MGTPFYFSSSLIDEGLRLDEFLASRLGISRNQVKQRVSSLVVNGKPCKLSKKLVAGLSISGILEPVPHTELVPQDIELSVLYEDEFCIVIDKPQGLVVHPGAGNPEGTVANALAYRYFSAGLEYEEEGFDDVDNLRPGIVHRLDKDTSGVLLAAKDKASQEFFSSCFRERQVKKIYLAVVKGLPSAKNGTIEGWLRRSRSNRKKFILTEHDEGGKFSQSFYSVLSSYGRYSLVALYPHTGRTHQLRVHMAHIGCPILGDPLYSRVDSSFPDATLMLHAYRLTIPLPDKKRIASFRAPLPVRFKEVLRTLSARYR
ncbi:RluA family pseudouridine synthase [Spirochaetia bacterium 38H-sp]|uniref:Pseudouridine synthase n=1 Tax=Rarispira pelagica TaxID=3141764 RepID=A0ABU9UB57_9SPIR